MVNFIDRIYFWILFYIIIDRHDITLLSICHPYQGQFAVVAFWHYQFVFDFQMFHKKLKFEKFISFSTDISEIIFWPCCVILTSLQSSQTKTGKVKWLNRGLPKAYEFSEQRLSPYMKPWSLYWILSKLMTLRNFQ